MATSIAIALMLMGRWTVASDDPIIAYHQGLRAVALGNTDDAFEKFKIACLAADGLFDACVRLETLARADDNDKVRQQALAAAVMLRPADVGARYRLAMHLLEKGDFAFAQMHLRAALEASTIDNNRRLLRYYLGYTLYKLERFEDAAAELRSATPLSPEVAQRRDFYLGRIALDNADRNAAVARLQQAEKGPDKGYATAAKNIRIATSAFPYRKVLGGLASASLGINTHPASAFLDAPGTDSGWTLASIFRADAVVRHPIGDQLVEGALTLYRDQGYTTFGKDTKADGEAASMTEAARIPAKDFNLTLILGQAGYRRLFIGRRWEHELRALVEGEVQLLDGVPEKIGQDGVSGIDFRSGDFGVNTFAAGGRLWWTFAQARSALTSIRFRVEGRPNRSDPDRSSVRVRGRIVHTHTFLGGALKGKGLLGLRFDRAYADPDVTKYDRLLPELELDIDWQTPLSRLSLTAGGTVKLNVYPNSAFDSVNTFRTPWQDDPDRDLLENEALRRDYYTGLLRLDLEWEARAEASVALWKRGELALSYRHHERLSNIDADTPPDHFDLAPGEENRYGYRQDLLELVIRQGF